MLKTWGVEIYNNHKISAGKCLIQQLGSMIDYSYDLKANQFNIAKGQQYELLHGSACPCWNSTQTIDKPIRVATIAMLCDRNDYFLLTRRHKNLKSFPQAWVFPGGMVEANQDLENECLREVHEETGINCQEYGRTLILKNFYESIYPTMYSDVKELQKQTLCIFFELKISDIKENIKVKVQESEVDNYIWIHKSDLLDIASNKAQNHPELSGIYPNIINQGIGEGHIISFQQCYQEK